MASFAYFLTLATSLLLLGKANCQYLAINPICHRAETTDVTTLLRCADTSIASIRAVSNASDDFDEACANLDEGGAADQGLDVTFYDFQVCGKFGLRGRFYGNTDDAITSVALLKVALEVAAEDNTDPALRYICRGLDLALYRGLQLSADTIYDVACGGLYIPGPSSSTSYSAASTTTTQSSSVSTLTPSTLTTPPTYLTSTTSSPSGSSSTPCSTSSYSLSVALHRRQTDIAVKLEFWIKYIRSAAWALTIIESNDDEEQCDVDDYWVNQWNDLGYFGDYVEALVCASAANNTLFPPKTIVEAKASLITALRGIMLTRDRRDELARRTACNNLSYSVLVQVGFDPQDVNGIINYICYFDASSTSSDGLTSSTSSSGSLTSTLSSTSVTTTSASLSSTSGSASSTTTSTSGGPTSTSSSLTTSLSSSTSGSPSSTSLSSSSTASGTSSSTSASSSSIASGTSSSTSASSSSIASGTSSSTSTSSSSSISASSSSTLAPSSSTASGTSSSLSTSSSTSLLSLSSSTSSSTSSSSSSSTSSSSSSSTSSSSPLTSSASATSTLTTSTTSSSPLLTSSQTTSSSSGATTTSTTSSSSSDSFTVDPNSTSSSISSSSSSSSSALCSYAYNDRGYYYHCDTTTLGTSYSTTATPSGY